MHCALGLRMETLPFGILCSSFVGRLSRLSSLRWKDLSSLYAIPFHRLGSCTRQKGGGVGSRDMPYSLLLDGGGSVSKSQVLTTMTFVHDRLCPQPTS